MTEFSTPIARQQNEYWDRLRQQMEVTQTIWKAWQAYAAEYQMIRGSDSIDPESFQGSSAGWSIDILDEIFAALSAQQEAGVATSIAMFQALRWPLVAYVAPVEPEEEEEPAPEE